MQQAVEIVLRHKGQAREAHTGRLKNVAVSVEALLRDDAGLFQAVCNLSAAEQQSHCLARRLPGTQPVGPHAAAVAEQQPFGRVFFRQTELPSEKRRVAAAEFGIVFFAQQSAAAFVETHQPEKLFRTVGLRRRLAVHGRCPFLRAEVFPVQPQGFLPRDAFFHALGQVAAEGFDNDVGSFVPLRHVAAFAPQPQIRVAVAAGQRGQAGAEGAQGRFDVSHRVSASAFVLQNARQPPADADVAEIVDHRAENMAGRGRVHRGSSVKSNRTAVLPPCAVLSSANGRKNIFLSTPNGNI